MGKKNVRLKLPLKCPTYFLQWGISPAQVGINPHYSGFFSPLQWGKLNTKAFPTNDSSTEYINSVLEKSDYKELFISL